MTFIRRNVWELGGDWAGEVLWYARGVAAMKARALATPTSWRFYAGMHGFSSARWQELGYLFPTDQPPSQALLSTFWAQCQHGSWYFLPWHRGYVLALEANIRAEVVALNGPPDWALPYWNYFKPNQAALPPAFAGPDWPDGVGNNPLFVEQRYGPNGDGHVFVPTNQVDGPQRGHGLARELMAEAEAMARRRGCRLVMGITYDVLTRGFYDRLGYRTVGIIDNCPADTATRWYCKDL